MTEPTQAPDPQPPELGAELAPPSARARRVRLGLLLIALLLVAFVGGIFTQRLVGPAAADTSQGQRAGRFGPGASAAGQPPGGAARAGTAGAVQKVDGTTLVLSGRDGSTTTVTTDGSTQVQVSKPGTLTDLPPGTQVIVQGTRNADGTVSATRITVSPATG